MIIFLQRAFFVLCLSGLLPGKSLRQYSFTELQHAMAPTKARILGRMVVVGKGYGVTVYFPPSMEKNFMVLGCCHSSKCFSALSAALH